MKKHLKTIKQTAHRSLGLFWHVLMPVRRVLSRLWYPVGSFLVAEWQKAGHWYDRQAQRYPILQRLWFRLTLITIATAIVLSPIYAVITQYVNDQSYKLTAKETSLLGRSTVDAKFIKETTDAITYNRADEQPEAKGVEQAITLAASKTDATGKQPYQAELSKDHKKGITFSDGAAEQSMTLLPEF